MDEVTHTPRPPVYTITVHPRERAGQTVYMAYCSCGRYRSRAYEIRGTAALAGEAHHAMRHSDPPIVGPMEVGLLIHAARKRAK